MRKVDQFYEHTPNQRIKREQCVQKLLRRLWIDANSENKCDKLDGMDQGLMDTKETQQDLNVFMDYDEKQMENTNWTKNDLKPATRT